MKTNFEYWCNGEIEYIDLELRKAIVSNRFCLTDKMTQSQDAYVLDGRFKITSFMYVSIMSGKIQVCFNS